MNAKRFSLLILVVLFPLTLIHAQERRGPFVHEPRSVRTRPFDTKHIRLELAFDWEREVVRGRTVQTFVPFAPLKQIELDSAGIKIDAVALVRGTDDDERTKLDYRTEAEKLVITLDREYGPDDELVVAIDYMLLKPERGVHFVTPDEHEPDQARIVWTQSEPEDARHWFPCCDSPAERCTSEMLATVPDGYFVLSNGVLNATRENEDGTKTWHWLQKQEHAPYLISVVAGEFVPYEQEWDGIPIVSYVPPSRLADAERSFGKTAEMVQHFSELIGVRYPWPKYTQICCDEYGGGMEHTSATTLTLGTLHDERAHLDFSSDWLVAHELAHQWWGDLLTCKDWAELWLNESFATFAETIWAEHDQGWDEAVWRRYRQGESYFDEDKNHHRRPIVSYRYEQPWNMFDRHSYPKGGRVLHMLRFVLGDDLFWKAIGHYTAKHSYDTVETADLRVAIEEATGQGLNWFFDEWLYRGGHPEYDVSYEWDDAEKLVRIKVRQTQKVNDLTPLFRMPIEIGLVTPSQTVTRRVTVAKAEETFSFALDERPLRVLFDPNDWVLKKLTFDKSKEEWIDQLLHEPHMICRFRAAEALAEHTPQTDVLDALTSAAANDEFWAVRKQCVESIGKFNGDAAREALLAIAKNDKKSDVRVAAIKVLADFKHADTNKRLREVIAEDQSYAAVAEALRTLVKVDRENAAKDVLAAIDQPSHREVILRAVCDGLVELEVPDAKEKVLAVLNPPSTPQQRVAAMDALAKLAREGDSEITEALIEQLQDSRRLVRSAAATALAETGDAAALDALLARRDKEQRAAMLATVDKAIKKLRSDNNLAKLQKEVEDLRAKNRQLDERIDELEQKAKQ